MDDFDESYADVLQQANELIAKKFKPFESMDTLTTHGGYEASELESLGHPVIAPISLATTFQQFTPGVAKYDYSRAGNFSRECLEKCIATLENGGYCSLYSSGLAALGAILQLLSSGDHIVALDDLYGGSGRYLRTIASNAGLQYTMVDMRNLDEFKSAIQPHTKLILAESPSNPLMHLVDIAEVSRIAHEVNPDILVVVDNTFMSPYFQHPLEQGADIVLHSLTKYINGHSDVVMGAVVIGDDPDLAKKFSFLQLAGGAVPSPFDCYLCLRGIRTLAVRMRSHMLNGLIVAIMLQEHPMVEAVIHPGLESFAQKDIVEKQMRGFSGMVTVYLRCSAEDTQKVVQNVKLFTLAESLGGYESLIEIPSIMTHASVPPELRQKNGISDSMLRLSVGLEDPKDLCKDLFQAFDSI